MAQFDLDAAVRSTYGYEPASGRLFWLSDGRRAGLSYPASPYIRLTLRNTETGRQLFLRAHRVAWFLFWGKWPEQTIDHINGIKTDNRIDNLRDVHGDLNRHNIRRANRNSASGLLGASWDKQKRKWVACIQCDGKLRRLGFHASPQEAHAAYLAAKRVLHEGFVA